MRTIRYGKRFKRDDRHEKSGVLGQKRDALLKETIDLLAGDATVPPRFVDHTLVGDWKDYRDCHIRPGLVLISRKPDDEHRDLVRLGSNGELSL
jgi:mRNA interferase YafQ